MSDPLVWARFLHFAATVSLSGLVMFHAWVGAPALSAGGADAATVRLIAGRLARLAWASFALAVLTGAAALMVQAASMGERPLSDLWSDGLLATVLLDAVGSKFKAMSKDNMTQSSSLALLESMYPCADVGQWTPWPLGSTTSRRNDARDSGPR